MNNTTISNISDELIKSDIEYLDLLVSHLQTGTKLGDSSIYSFNNQGMYIVNGIIETYTKILIKAMSQLPIGGELTHIADILYTPSSLFLNASTISGAKDYINKEIYLKEIANTIVRYINNKNKKSEIEECYLCIDEYENKYQVFANYDIKVTTKDNKEKDIKFPYTIDPNNKVDLLFVGKAVVFMTLYDKKTSSITIYGGRLTYQDQVPDITWIRYGRTLTVNYYIGTIKFVNDGLVLVYPNTGKLHILTISNKYNCIDYYVCDHNTYKGDIKDLVLSRIQATHEECDEG